MAEKMRNIGIDVKKPQGTSKDDKNCPFFGQKVVRGRTLVGKVIKAKAKKSAVIEIERTAPLRKYERFEKRRTRIMVHNPEAINAQENDIVKVMETRRMSKMKSFVIVEKLSE